MCPSPVARNGDAFEGHCSVCNLDVTGVLESSEHIKIDGEPVCVDGCSGLGSCRHTCTVLGGSTLLYINGKAAARVGDAVTGDITGHITTGSSLIASD